MVDSSIAKTEGLTGGRMPDRARWTRIDGLVVAAVGLAAFLFAQWYMPVYRAAGGVALFYQQEFGPAVMLACGKGFSNPEPPVAPPLRAFLDQRTDRVRCDELPQSIALGQPDAFQRFSRYLMTAVAVVWQATGISWGAVDLLTAGFFGIAISGAYVAVRFVCGRTLSLGVALLWALSPWHLQNLPHLRDYSKVPFFVVMLIATAMLFTERRAKRVIALGAAFGLIQGFGYGMRADVGLNFIPFLLVLFAAAPDLYRHYKVRLACTAAAAATFTLAAYPVLVTYNETGTLWHVTLLGLTTPFDANLNLAVPPPPYDFGYLYDDRYVETVVRSHWDRVHPDGASFQLWSRTYGVACREYFEALARVFPGDLLTRTVAATVNVTNLPFLSAAGHVPLGISNRALVALYELRGRLMDRLEGSGPLAIAAVLVAIGMERPRYAVIAFLLLCSWTGYTSLQYLFRHVFHLELIVLAAVAAGVSLMSRQIGHVRRQRDQPTRETTRRGLMAIGTVGGLFLAVGLTLVVARAIQVPKTRGLLTAYGAAPVDSVAVTSVLLPDGRIRLDAPVFGVPPADGVQTAMLVAEFDGRCAPSPSMASTFRYEVPGPWSGFDFSRVEEVALDQGAGRATRVFLPVYAVYQRATLISRFAGVEVAARDVPCVRLYRVRDLGSLPLLLPATLTSNWAGEALYQRFRVEMALPLGLRRLFGRTGAT